MLEALKEKTYRANLDLARSGLVMFTWGNVSIVDRATETMVIKPSGMAYEEMTAADMAVADFTGRQTEGGRRPSTDSPTHGALYRAFPEIGSVVHTHSRWATVFAQLRRDIPALGTTHGDTFFGPVPCTRPLTPEEIAGCYEYETGRVIAETFRERGLSPAEVPAVLVASHGPFVWGKDADEALYHARVLEEVARMAYACLSIDPDLPPMQPELLQKHFGRKHGSQAYYGQ